MKRRRDARPERRIRIILLAGCFFVAVALLRLVVVPAWAAAPPADPVKGKALYTKTCVACHGDQAQGKREINSPALHTQEPWYISAQLQKFREGIRGADPKDVSGALMRPIAQALPDDQSLLDLATYISAIEGPPAKNEVKGDAAAGGIIFKKTCVACHGDNARGKPEIKSPSLVGQSDWYVVMQLAKFKQGLRGAHSKDVTGAQMRAITSTLQTEQSIKDVAAYLATLK